MENFCLKSNQREPVWRHGSRIRGVAIFNLRDYPRGVADFSLRGCLRGAESFIRTRFYLLRIAAQTEGLLLRDIAFSVCNVYLVDAISIHYFFRIHDSSFSCISIRGEFIDSIVPCYLD